MKVIAKNRRANFDYDITTKYIAGLSLVGTEVKSVKAGYVSLKGSYITARGEELYLTGAHINAYPFATVNHDPERSRKLLLHRREINTIAAAISAAGMSAVPLMIGTERGLVKLELGVGRGKKHYDKRETVQRRELAREADRTIKDRGRS